MAFMSMFFVLIVFVMLCIFAVGLIGLSLFIAGLITGHENKTAVKMGRKSSNIHIGLKVSGVLLMIPSILIAAFFISLSVKTKMQYKKTDVYNMIVDGCSVRELETVLINGAPPEGTGKNKDMNIPLIKLCSTTDSDAREKIRLLLEYGADVNVSDKETGRTPLMTACSISDPEKVKILLENGAEVNAVDSDGNTPLIYVANSYNEADSDYHKQEKASIAGLLLENGADAGAVGSDGTALDIAEKKGFIFMAELLKDN